MSRGVSATTPVALIRHVTTDQIVHLDMMDVIKVRPTIGGLIPRSFMYTLMFVSRCYAVERITTGCPNYRATCRSAHPLHRQSIWRAYAEIDESQQILSSRLAVHLL